MGKFLGSICMFVLCVCLFVFPSSAYRLHASSFNEKEERRNSPKVNRTDFNSKIDKVYTTVHKSNSQFLESSSKLRNSISTTTSTKASTECTSSLCSSSKKNKLHLTIINDEETDNDEGMFSYERQPFKSSCISNCFCWPVFLVCFFMTLLLDFLTLYFIYLISKLMPEAGLTEYMNKGGYILVGAFVIGSVIGFLIGYFVFKCISFSLLFSSWVQAFINCIILLGKRGALLGIISGAYGGFLLGIIINNSFVSIMVSMFVLLFVGFLIGYSPIFKSFYLNELYLQEVVLKAREEEAMKEVLLPEVEDNN